MNSKLKLLLVILLLLSIVGTSSIVVVANDTEQQAQFSAPILLVNTSFLNVRTGPGVYYSVLMTVVGGTELPVLGVFDDKVWYQVSTVAGAGWVNVEFTAPRGDFTNVPFVEAPEIVGVAGVDDMMDDNMPSGDDAVGTNGFQNGRAWGISIVESHLGLVGSVDSTLTYPVEPDLSTIYTVLEGNMHDNKPFYLIDSPFAGLVWIDGTKSAMRPYGCDYWVVRFDNGAAPGIGPDGSGTINGNVILPAGSEAYLVGELMNFYQVELFDGNVGWVPKSGNISVRAPGDAFAPYCEDHSGMVVMPSGDMQDVASLGQGGGGSPDDNDEPRPGGQAAYAAAKVVINTGFLNIRSGPGAQYSVVATVSGGTELPVIGFAPDGVWYMVQGNFGTGWLNSEFTAFRGDGRAIPIIEDAVGELSRPQAMVTNAVVLYAAPNSTLGQIGSLTGPINVWVVARTADFNWVQLDTTLGFGWVKTNSVILEGDLTSIPIAAG